MNENEIKIIYSDWKTIYYYCFIVGLILWFIEEIIFKGNAGIIFIDFYYTFLFLAGLMVLLKYIIFTKEERSKK